MFGYLTTAAEDGESVHRMKLVTVGAALIALSVASPDHAATTIAPSIKLVAAAALTYENQSTTLTGTVTYKLPDGSVKPLANQPIQVSCYLACTGFATTTDANGKFAVPVTATWWEMSVTASIAATSTVTATSTTLWLYPHSPTRIIARARPSVLTSSTEPVTISGVLQYQGDDGSWKPLPGRQVDISGAGANATVSTAPDGSFTDQVTLTASTTSVTQQVSGEWSPWFENSAVDQTALTNVTITTPAAVAFSRFTATVSALGSVTASGAVSVAPSTAVTIRLEYSANGMSGWKALGSVATYSGFSHTFRVPLPTAWYRGVVVAGTDNVGATSAAVKAGRTVTRISKFKVSATRVRAGGSFRISGVLQKFVHGTWKALARQRVWILLRPRGSSTWYWYRKPLTSSSGSFNVKVKVVSGMPSARWIPVFYGAPGYYACAPAKAVNVTIVRSGRATSLILLPPQRQGLPG